MNQQPVIFDDPSLRYETRRFLAKQKTKRKEVGVRWHPNSTLHKHASATTRLYEKGRLLPKQKAKLELEEEAGVRWQRIALGNSLVTFSAGLEITRVVPGINLSVVTVKNLPIDAEIHEVKEIFTQQGIHADDVFVEKLILTDNTKQASVYAKSDDAKIVGIGLEEIEFRDNKLQFDVREMVSAGAMKSSSPSNPILHISWDVPLATYIVSYSSPEEAQANIQRLDQSFYEGQKLTANSHEQQWQIRVRGLPPDMSKEDIFLFLKADVVTLIMTFDIQESINTLRSFLEEQPENQRPVDFDVVSENDKGMVKVKATFATWDVARQVGDTLNTRKCLVADGPSYIVVVPKEHQFSVAVSPKQYKAQKMMWEELKSGEIPSLPIFEANKDGHDEILITIQGDDKKAVGALKVRAENLAAGEMLSSDYWNISFTTPMGRTFLNSVFDQTGVFVICDGKQQTLTVYGDSQDSVQNARRLITEEIERLKAVEFTICVTSPATIQFLSTQKRKDILKETIGEENISFYLDTRPRKLVVRGGDNVIDTVKKIIKDSSERFVGAQDAQDVDNNDTCPVCRDEVKLPEQLGCGHTYCRNCLRRYVLSEADRYPLVCIGSDGTCRRKISLPVIQQLIHNSIALQQTIDRVFKLYIDQHPDELRYCSTPDCRQVYGRNTNNAVELQCPSCFITTCSKCDSTDSHAGMTCGDYRIYNNPLLQEELNDVWADANGAKKCPRCQVFIQKTTGCNHIPCKCGVHFCWVCGRFCADNSNAVYQHMRSVHGGIDTQAEAPQNVNRNRPRCEVPRREVVDQRRPYNQPRHVQQVVQAEPSFTGLFLWIGFMGIGTIMLSIFFS